MDDRTTRERRHDEGRCVNCGQMLFDDGNIHTTLGGFLLIMTAGACVGALLTLGLIALLDWLAARGWIG